MADIRINALATTATTPASDDYLALDGAAQGTRKILATNIANNVTDVILGSSGPSVKSTLSARAPRQGLVFDTTANATVASVAAFGTSDFTIAAIVRKDSLAAAKILIGGQSNSFGLTVNTNGTVITSLVNVADNTASTGTIAAGKTAVVVYSRSGTTGTYYINGVAAGTTTDSRNYSVAFTSIGGAPGNAAVLDGSLSVLAYNRALSASEVVALYEAGAPAGADYNSASNTSLSTSWSNYTSPGYDTFSSASATGFSAVASTAGNHYAYTGDTRNVSKGQAYRVTFTLTVTSGVGPAQLFMAKPGSAATTDVFVPTAGSNSFVLTINQSAAYDANRLFFGSTASGNFTISNLIWIPLGLLLAPDAAQAGGGLVWYDTSGNAANITLPASGVSWNVPSSRVLGGNWTTSGNLTVSGTGTSSVAGNVNVAASASGTAILGLGVTPNTWYSSSAFAAVQMRGISLFGNTGGAGGILAGNQYLDSGGTWRFVADGAGSWYSFQSGIHQWYTAAAGSAGGAATNTELMRLATNGNLLIGGTIDGGQKLQVSGTGYFSGNVGIGATSGTGRLTVYGGQTEWGATSSLGFLGYTGGNPIVGSLGALSLLIYTNGTEAARFDSSQNATFKGTELNLNPNSGNAFIYSRVTGGGIGGIVIADSQASGRTYGIESGRTAGSFAIRDYTAAANRLTIDSAGAATFGSSITTSAPTGGAGAWELGVYTATAPTATGYVTIEIGGVQYKLLAST